MALYSATNWIQHAKGTLKSAGRHIWGTALQLRLHSNAGDLKYFFRRNNEKDDLFIFAGTRMEYMVREDKKVNPAMIWYITNLI